MNWAIIGASTIATQYVLPALRAVAGNRALWVVSGSKDRAAQVATDFGIPNATTDLTDALADTDVAAVYISSRNDMHFGQAMQAIEAGKHVLCEKPLALTVDQAAQMVAAADRAGVVLAANHHLRNAGSHREIQRLVASGAIGRVLSARVFHAVELPDQLRGWRLDQPDAGGGVIADLTVHNADAVRAILGEDPVSVMAHSAASGLGQGVEDSAMSIWTMPSGAMVFSHESFTHPVAETGIEVHGTDGSIRATGVFAQDPGGEITLTDKTGSRTVSFDLTDLYQRTLEQFHQAVAGGQTSVATGTDGLRAMQIAEAVRKSAANGTSQPVQYGEVA